MVVLVTLVLSGCMVAPVDKVTDNRYEPEQADPEAFWRDEERYGRNNINFNPCPNDNVSNKEAGYTSSHQGEQQTNRGRTVHDKVKTYNNGDC